MDEYCFDMAHTHKPPFNPALRALGNKFNAIYVRQLLRGSDYEVDDSDLIESELRKKWNQFLEHELHQLKARVKTEKWLW